MAKQKDTPNRQMAQLVAKALGGEPQVSQFLNDATGVDVDIMTCKNQPNDGESSYGTLGLSDSPIYLPGEAEEYPTRVELVGACRAEYDIFPNVLADAAMLIAAGKADCYPGAVIEDVLTKYDVPGLPHHVLLTPPFLWDGELVTTQFGDKVVSWLMLIPIFDSEMELCQDAGYEELAKRLEENRADVLNLERLPVA